MNVKDHIDLMNGKTPVRLNPQEFVDKLGSDFLPVLNEKLQDVYPGSKVIEVSQSNGGIDITLEDKNGYTETFCVDPMNQSWIKVIEVKR